MMDDVGSSRTLFLDDDPERATDFLSEHPHAVWVETAAECIERLSEPWDEVHLDHDLGREIFVDSDRTDCGMEVVRWLANDGAREHLLLTFFVVHTHNMNAAGVMVRRLREAGYSAIYRPFGIDFLRWLEEAKQREAAPPLTPSRAPWRARIRRLIDWLARRRGTKLPSSSDEGRHHDPGP